jgi:transaldolase
MALYLDSASPEDLLQALALGLIRGVTTNPNLEAQQASIPRRGMLFTLCRQAPGPVFVQLTGADLASREVEAEELLQLDATLRDSGPDWPQNVGRKIGLKIPSTSENLALAARLVRRHGRYDRNTGRGALVGMTAIFDPAQVYLACEAGACYVLPYVNRATRLLGDGNALVSQMRQLIDALRSDVEIIAASIKSPQEAVAATLAGAHHLTLPLAILLSLGEHALSQQAIEEFARVGDVGRRKEGER